MYPPPVKIFHGPGPRKRSRGVAAKAAVSRPLGTPAEVVIRLAKNALCASRRSTFRSFRRRLLLVRLVSLLCLASRPHANQTAAATGYHGPVPFKIVLHPLPRFR